MTGQQFFDAYYFPVMIIILLAFWVVSLLMAWWGEKMMRETHERRHERLHAENLRLRRALDAVRGALGDLDSEEAGGG